MADSKGGFFSKTVQKHAGRAKERILQNLGKADKTRDELFDEYLNNFTRQQNAALKINKEIKHYVSCIKEMQAANKSLFETLGSVYEPEWLGHEQLYLRSQHIDVIWSDYSHKLNDQVMIPLQTYLNQFPDIKEKIGKRGRKLVDYDRQRHNFESLQNNPKKKDDIKISKSKEQLDDAKKCYEILNNELHDDLPALYDSRIPFMISSLQTVFTAETVFHNEVSKVYGQLGELMEKLALENQKGTYMQKRPDSPNFNKSHERPYEEISVKKEDAAKITVETNGDAVMESPNSKDIPSDSVQQEESPRVATDVSTSDISMHDTSENVTGYLSSPPRQTPKKSDGGVEAGKKALHATIESENVVASAKVNEVDSGALKNAETNKKPADNEVTKKVEELYDIPVGATTADLPPGILYRVKATYKYICEDADELSFEPGEIIQVIEYDEPEEQEDGWLSGVLEQTGQKGLFPANFTRPI